MRGRNTVPEWKKKKELEWSISHVKVSSGNKLQGKINTVKKKNKH